MKLFCVKNKLVRAFREVRLSRYAGITVSKPLKLKRFILAAAACALLIPLVLMDAYRTDARIAEFWTSNIARGWEQAAGTVTSVFPFSVFEFFVCVLILVGGYLFVRLVINLCRAHFKKILTGLLAVAVGAISVANLYMMSMGFGYYRDPMPLYVSGADYKAEQVKTVVEYFLPDLNALADKFERDENGCVIPPYSFAGIAEKLKAEYARLDDDYFFSYTPSGKPIVNSWFLSAVNITGITFLPTGEANLNTLTPSSYATFTLAHEIAHTKGVQREGDANVLAQYVLLNAEDDYLRYCGYYKAFLDLVGAVNLAGDNKGWIELYKQIDPRVLNEKRYENSYWASQPTFMRDLGEFFNNLYLKINGAINGTGSYTDGNKTDTVTPVDPDTGEPERDPETHEPVIIPVYSTVQKMFFYIYEARMGGPPPIVSE
ncbi:MAG: DUF3810 domain-containing protein [Clostridiales bacterium]|nr:DUF3810 domain-containing protein [Clostridiales bacterium]